MSSSYRKCYKRYYDCMSEVESKYNSINSDKPVVETMKLIHQMNIVMDIMRCQRKLDVDLKNENGF